MTGDLLIVIREHCSGLSRKRWVYKWYLALDAAGFRDQELQSIWPAYAALAELVVSNEISEPTLDFAAAISRIHPIESLSDIFVCWQRSLQAVYPKRALMDAVLQHFLDWLASAGPEDRASFLAVIPDLAPSLGKMEQSRATGMIQRLSSLGTDERRVILKMLSEYGGTRPDVLLAFSSLATSAARMKDLSLIDRLRGVMAPDEVLPSRDARRFFPAVDQLSTICTQRGPMLWAAAMNLVVTLSSGGHISSGYVIARDLPMRIGGLDDESACSYLDAFNVLARHIGVSIVGFGLLQLPKAFRVKGTERAVAIAHAAARISDLCGKTAAHAFLEGRTDAARAFLGSAR